METRASYVLVGAFVLGLIAVGIIFVLWVSGSAGRGSDILMTVQFKQDVTGLNNNAVVRYRGIPIGKVRDIGLDPKNPEFVLVKINVRPDAQIYPDFVAALEQQGLTGSPFIQLKRPAPKNQIVGAEPVMAADMSPALRDRRISGTPTQLQKVFEELPKAIASIRELTERAAKVVAMTEGMVASPNGKSVGSIVKSLEKAAADIASFTTDSKAFAKEARAVAEELRPAAKELTGTIKSVRNVADKASVFIDDAGKEFPAALKSVRKLADKATGLADGAGKELDATLKSIRKVSDRAGELLSDENRKSVASLIKSLELTVADIDKFVKEVASRTRELEPAIKALPGTIKDIAALTKSATDLSERASSFLNDENRKRFSRILASVDVAARDADKFIQEAEKVARDLRPALKNLPQMVQNISVFTSAAAKLSDRAAAFFDEANRKQVEQILVSAESAAKDIGKFARETEKVAKEVRPAIKDLGQALSRVANTVKQVEEGAKVFNAMSQQITALVRENRKPIGRFMNSGLYEVSQFLTDGRRLIRAFTRLTQRIENDPSRFFFGQQGGLNPRRQ